MGYEGPKRHRLGLRQNLPESSEIPEPTALNRLANKGLETFRGRHPGALRIECSRQHELLKHCPTKSHSKMTPLNAPKQS